MTCLKLGYSHGKFTNVRVVGALDPQWYAELQRTGAIPIYPKPLIRWPAAALKEGRIPAPNLEHAKVLFNDEFDDPKSGWPQGKKENPLREFGYQNGKYSIRILGPRDYRGYLFDTPIKDLNDFACEIVARSDASVSARAGKWGLHLLNPEKQVGISLCVEMDGSLGIWPGWDNYQGPYVSVISHDAIKKGNELNRLLAVVRGRQVEVYVNGVAVCDPVTMPADFTPVTVKLSFHSGKEAEAQFERVTVWSAQGLPTPKERLETGEVPITTKSPVIEAPRLPQQGPAAIPNKAAAARSPFETWPETELLAGKVPMPDLTAAKLLYSDEFDDPKSGFPTFKATKGHADSGYLDGKYFIYHKAARRNPRCIAGEPFAIQARGRSAGTATNSWSICLDNHTSSRSVGVGISGEGKLIIGRGFFESIGTLDPTVVEHPAIKKGGEWNELTLVLREKLLEVYVNGIAVCQPVRLNGDLLPSVQPSMSVARSGNEPGEFEWLKLYSAATLAPVSERVRTLAPATHLSELEKKLFPSLVHVKLAGDSRMTIGVVTESGVCTILPGTFQSVELVALDGKRTFAGTVTSRKPFPFCWIESKDLDLPPVTSAKTGTVYKPQEAFVALFGDGATKLHAGKIEASGAFAAPVEVAPQQGGVVAIGPIFAADGTCLGLSLKSDRDKPVVIYPVKRD